MWRLWTFRLDIAAESVAAIVDAHDGYATLGTICEELVKVPKYQKLYGKGKLNSLIKAAAKRSKVLGLFRFYNGLGSKDAIVGRVVALNKDAEVRK